jgi:DNA-binding winged helix-turn-helix (wHTH) protein/Flp pilus assembly protein TadD
MDRMREIYEFGDFRLDVGERTLVRRRHGEPVALPEKAYRTLVHLVRNAGALVSREAILTAVWPDVVVENANVAKVVHILRTTLGDGSSDESYIETVAKHGYRMVADVARVSAGTVPPPARSPAYDLYVRGKVKAGSENVDDINEAIALFESAVALDPSWAPAFAQLARACNTRSFKFASLDEGKRFRENADVALAKALDLDPTLAEAHFARGLIVWTKAKGFPHAQAIQAFTRALELDPDADETHHQLSLVYAHVGLLDEARYHVTKAIDLNPNNTMARFRVGVYAAWQCRFEEALAVLKTVPHDVSPILVDRTRAEIYLQLGRPDRAASIVDDYLVRHPADPGGSLTSVRALLLARTGDRREARTAIARAIELGTGFGHFHHTAHNVASAYAALNELDSAVMWVEAAADDGFPCYPYFARDPNLDGLREYPPFVALMSALRRQWHQFKRARRKRHEQQDDGVSAIL